MNGRRIFKALPTVYEDALSYYEVLSKLIGCMEEMQEILNGDLTDYMKQILKDVIFRATYDEKEEMIIFAHEIIQTGEDMHIYDSNDNTIYVKAKE